MKLRTPALVPHRAIHDEEENSASATNKLASIEQSMKLGRSYYESGNYDSAFNAYVKVMSSVLSVPIFQEEGGGVELSDVDWESLMAHCEKYEIGQGQNLTKMALFAIAAMSVGNCLQDMYQYEAAEDKFLLALAVRERYMVRSICWWRKLTWL